MHSGDLYGLSDLKDKACWCQVSVSSVKVAGICREFSAALTLGTSRLLHRVSALTDPTKGHENDRYSQCGQ